MPHWEKWSFACVSVAMWQPWWDGAVSGQGSVVCTALPHPASPWHPRDMCTCSEPSAAQAVVLP